MRNHHPRRNHRRNYIPLPDLRLMARGRWVEILTAAGVPADALTGRHGRPCPRCGGRDRFTPLADVADRGAVLCRHCFNADTVQRPGDGLATLRWWLSIDLPEACRWLEAWLGVMPGYRVWQVAAAQVQPVVKTTVVADPKMGLMADVMVGNMRPGWLARAADMLKLTSESLSRLSVGWSPAHRAVSFPMRDDDGAVIGIRLRCPRTARKWAVKGSRAGLFYSVELLTLVRPGRVYVAEGPTDAAALLSVGLHAVGVPSAGGSGDLLMGLMARVVPDDVVVVADGDGAGLRGAESLAVALRSVVPVRIISPPEGIKDARAWVVSGADGVVVDARADHAQVHPVAREGK